jgi:hypothetical protein
VAKFSLVRIDQGKIRTRHTPVVYAEIAEGTRFVGHIALIENNFVIGLEGHVPQ